jgi:hypothetical protein
MAQVVHTNRRHSNCIRITAAGRGHGTGPAYANQARGVQYARACVPETAEPLPPVGKLAVWPTPQNRRKGR